MGEHREAGTSRRSLLAGGLTVAGLAGAGLLASCSGAREPSTGASGSPAESASDDPVRARAVAAEQALIAAYDTALAEGADPLLEAIRAQHRAHLDALGGTAVTADATTADATTAVPPTRAALAVLEREAATRGREHCLEAADPELVRTLAYIAASEASHVPALRAGA